MIRGSHNENYKEFWPHTKAAVHLIDMIYMFNIVKEYDIHIEVRKYLDGALKMTIDAKKIIPKLSVLLENEEKLKELKN